MTAREIRVFDLVRVIAVGDALRGLVGEVESINQVDTWPPSPGIARVRFNPADRPSAWPTGGGFVLPYELDELEVVERDEPA